MSRIELRIHPNEKAALERAAEAAGMTLSAYVRYRIEAPLPDFKIAQQVAEIMRHHQQCDLQQIALALEDLRQQISQFSQTKENTNGTPKPAAA